MKIKTIITITFFSLAVLLGTYLGINKQESQPASFAGVMGTPYKATTTDNFGSVSVGGFKRLKTGSGVLGSLIITNSTAGSLNFYDATTTVNGGVYGTTTLAKIAPSLAAGTYIFDVAFTKGLLVEFQSTNVASGTITYQ